MCNDIIMCKETEKLIKILQGSQNPTDMALIILANKMDDINKKIDNSYRQLDDKWEKKFNVLTEKTDKQIEELKKATHFAKWIGLHKKLLIGGLSLLLILATCGIGGITAWIKNKLGM